MRSEGKGENRERLTRHTGDGRRKRRGKWRRLLEREGKDKRVVEGRKDGNGGDTGAGK